MMAPYIGSELAALLRNRAEVELQRLGAEGSEATSLALTLVAEPVEVHPVQYAVLPRCALPDFATHMR